MTCNTSPFAFGFGSAYADPIDVALATIRQLRSELVVDRASLARADELTRLVPDLEPPGASSRAEAMLVALRLGLLQMAREEARRRVAEARVARLATRDVGGRLHLVPICFALSGDTLYSAVDRKPKRSRDLRRVANVRADPDVGVLVDEYEEDWTALWWVRLRGRARVLESGPERDRATALLREKYPPYAADPLDGPVLAIDVDEWRAWSARSGLTSLRRDS